MYFPNNSLWIVTSNWKGVTMADRTMGLVALFCCSFILMPSLSVAFMDCDVNCDSLGGNSSFIWRPNGEVPFAFASQINEADKEVMRNNFQKIAEKSCFKFKEVDFPDLANAAALRKTLAIDYDEGVKSCATDEGSFEAYVTDEFLEHYNVIKLGLAYKLADDPICTEGKLLEVITGGLLHETFHALGMSHMQRRSDRDKYIHINYDNTKYPAQFKPCDKTRCPVTEEVPFDCSSIMMYSAYTYAIQGKGPVIEPINKDTCKLPEMGALKPTEYDWQLVKIISELVCSGGPGDTGGPLVEGEGDYGGEGDVAYGSEGDHDQ